MATAKGKKTEKAQQKREKVTAAELARIDELLFDLQLDEAVEWLKMHPIDEKREKVSKRESWRWVY